MTAGSRILFLRDCYEADNRESAVFDLSSETVRHLQVPLMGGEFLCGAIDRIPIDRQAALAAQAELQLKQAEKRLVLGAFVLAGWLPPPRVGARRRRLLAPLLLLPATIEDAEPYAFVRADPDQARLNSRVLAALEDAEADAALDELAERLPGLPLPKERGDELGWALLEVFPSLDVSPLSRYPETLDRDALLAAIPAEGPIRVLPAVALLLAPVSPDTRHVLAELATLAGKGHFSAPLSRLIAPGREPPRRPEPIRLQAPTTLSGAQRRVLQSCASSPLSLIIGPPGTGKTHTVAAAALDHALRGQSVLVAARTEQAVDVLEAKLSELSGKDLLMRGGRGEPAGRPADTVDRLLQGLESTAEEDAEAAVRERHAATTALERQTERLARALERRARREERWGLLQVAAERPGWAGFFARHRLRLAEWRLSRRPPYWDQMETYQALLESLGRARAAELAARVRFYRQRALEERRADLVALGRALRSRTKRRLHQYFEAVDRRTLLGVFPIWLTTIADVGELLPFQAELFDLAIVDEATQCDPASVLPVLQRARRAAVTGDPKQLRHVSFLSDARLHRIAERHQVLPETRDELHYRNRSALDLASAAIGSQRQAAMLDEHFRSLPPLIAFSNRHFYEGRLKVMTQRPETVRRPCLDLRQVKGRRRDNGVNHEEAEAVIAELAALVSAEAALEGSVAQTIGVLSPFREQVDHIASLAAKRLAGPALLAHQVRIATPYGFQGEERDVMLLSLAVDDSSPAGSFRFLARDDVFNVSVTRARHRQVVFCSLREARKAPGWLGLYLEDVAGVPTTRHAGPGDADAFAEEVAAALTAESCRCFVAFPVAGAEIDLVVERGGRSLGIDLVGAPGRFHQAFRLERYRTLKRAGLRLFPLSLSAWRRDRSGCVAAVLRWLGSVRRG